MNIFEKLGIKRKRNSQIFEKINGPPHKRQNSNEFFPENEEVAIATPPRLNTTETETYQTGLLTPDNSPVKSHHYLLPLENKLQHLSVVQEQYPFSKNNYSSNSQHHIFQIPEIVKKIILYASNDCNNNASNGTSTLYNSLQVNRLWHDVTESILTEYLYFDSDSKLKTFLSNLRFKIKPTHVKLEKLHSQTIFYDMFLVHPLLDFSGLKHIELFICPNLLPPASWFQKTRLLETLAFPGNKLITDEYLILISAKSGLKNLSNLDLRACINITDSGITAMATNCPELTAVNVGRHRNGSKITSISVLALAENTKINTLGLAGCAITDIGIWELANICGSNIKRLSLNNCTLLTDKSIAILCGYNYFPNIGVLEIKNIKNITNVTDLVKFQSYKTYIKKSVLIQSCDRISSLIKEEEFNITRNNSLAALCDMTKWVNSNDTYN